MTDNAQKVHHAYGSIGKYGSKCAGRALGVAALTVALVASCFPVPAIAGIIDKWAAEAASRAVCTCMKNTCAARIGVDVEDSPNLNTWLARVMTEGIDGKGTLADYTTVTGLSTAQYLVLGEGMNQDVASLLSSAAWAALDKGPSMSAKTVYEALIMDYLAYEVDDTQKTDPFDPSKYNDFLASLYDAENDFITESLFKTGLVDASASQGAGAQTNLDKVSKANSGVSIALSQIATLDKHVIRPFMDTFLNTAVAQNASDERIYFLTGIKAAALKSQNPDYALVDAIDEILGCYEQASSQYYWTQASGAIAGTIWDETWWILSDSNPVLKGIQFAKGALDSLLDNNSRAESNLRLAVMYSLGLYAETALRDAHNMYLPYCNQNTEVEAAAAKGLVSCYYGYLEFQLYANTMAKSWIDVTTSLPLQDVFSLIGIEGFNQESANTSRDLINNQNNNYRLLLGELASKTEWYFKLFTGDCSCGCQAFAIDNQHMNQNQENSSQNTLPGNEPRDTEALDEKNVLSQEEAPATDTTPEIDYSLELHAQDDPAEESRIVATADEYGGYGYGMYDMYVAVLLDIAGQMDEYEESGIPGQAYYALYDLDGEGEGGIPELLVNYGMSFGTMVWHVYSVADDGLAVYEVGTFDGNRIDLYARTGQGIWGVFDAQGMWDVLYGVSKSGPDLYVSAIEPAYDDSSAPTEATENGSPVLPGPSNAYADIVEDARLMGPIATSWFSGGTDELDLELFEGLSH